MFGPFYLCKGILEVHKCILQVHLSSDRVYMSPLLQI